MVWAALTFTTRLPKPVDEPCVIQVVRVSGTIRKSEEAAIRLARQSIKRAQRQASGDGVLIADNAPGAKSRAKDDDLSMEDASGFENGIEDPDGPDDDESD